MGSAGRMQVGAVRWVFRLRQARSLKDKRKVVASLRDRIRARFAVAVSEVEGHDDKRKLVLGLALVGNDASELQATVDRIRGYVDGLYLAEQVTFEVCIEPFGSAALDTSILDPDFLLG